MENDNHGKNALKLCKLILYLSFNKIYTTPDDSDHWICKLWEQARQTLWWRKEIYAFEMCNVVVNEDGVIADARRIHKLAINHQLAKYSANLPHGKCILREEKWQISFPLFLCFPFPLSLALESWSSNAYFVRIKLKNVLSSWVNWISEWTELKSDLGFCSKKVHFRRLYIIPLIFHRRRFVAVASQLDFCMSKWHKMAMLHKMAKQIPKNMLISLLRIRFLLHFPNFVCVSCKNVGKLFTNCAVIPYLMEIIAHFSP